MSVLARGSWASPRVPATFCPQAAASWNHLAGESHGQREFATWWKLAAGGRLLPSRNRPQRTTLRVLLAQASCYARGKRRTAQWVPWEHTDRPGPTPDVQWAMGQWHRKSMLVLGSTNAMWRQVAQQWKNLWWQSWIFSSMGLDQQQPTCSACQRLCWCFGKVVRSDVVVLAAPWSRQIQEDYRNQDGWKFAVFGRYSVCWLTGYALLAPLIAYLFAYCLSA